MLTVYLFTQSIADVAPAMMQRRERALIGLRDELLQLGDLRVSASPQGSDLRVELLNLAGADENAAAQAAQPAGCGVERRRILTVRVWKETDRFDLVCSDGPGSVSAEHQAARRIHASADRMPSRSPYAFEPTPAHPC